MMNNKVKGIYIHIPFCQSICFYCDFCKVFYQEQLANDYLNVLKREYLSADINCSDIESIYLGGGTPSVLNYEQLEELLSFIDYTRYPNLKEFSIEVNPESLGLAKILLLKKYGINRLSIGIQTFNDDLLKACNRHHTKKQGVEVIKLLQANGFENISVDLIYGFNKQTKKDLLNDLKIVESLKIKHLSFYELSIEKGTVLANQKYQKNDEIDFDDMITSTLEKMGFEHYEVSNYAKDKNYSNHNLLYWHNERYYGFGLGAAGYLSDYRYYNTKSITNYLKGRYNRQIEPYNNQLELLKDEIMLKFRMFNGIDVKQIESKYNLDFTKYFERAIIYNEEKIFIKNNQLFFTKKGQLFLNDVILDFIEEIKE